MPAVMKAVIFEAWIINETSP